ncbi:glycosyltransferase family 2 protein [Salinarimonas soli]|uniref:Glycosyltransferase family 2 protein n=1 Tax=Salinarimonas soli TaxID=1638099 RepID=A0A5B2V894_9HYPH|nr:glycosyltransferase family A protein [Salinarimonas soli]KAA2235191.1 glycosyltransferase family 2 protein [Salinarimonas soli]
MTKPQVVHIIAIPRGLENGSHVRLPWITRSGGASGERRAMDVSVILPCYNGALTLRAQLDALARQSFSGTWELVFVDNGSTDDSVAIVETYRGRLPALTVVRAHDGSGPRQGVHHSYSVGFAHASGERFLLCEADDEVGDGWLQALGDALAIHPFAGAAIDYERLNEPTLHQGWTMQSREGGFLSSTVPLLKPWCIGCAMGLRREVYERIGAPTGECGTSWDIDYSWRAQNAGFPLTFVPEAVVHYRLRDRRRARFRQGRAWGDSQAQVLIKYAAPLSTGVVLRYHVMIARRAGDLVGEALRAARGTRTARYVMWELGWFAGHVTGLRHVYGTLFRRRGRKGDISADEPPVTA